jgi:ribosomal protein S18 acetylase RimI-like enzyme
MSATPHIEIVHVRADPDVAAARELFLEYAESIGVNLEYQGFSTEVATLPGQYAPPSGDLLVAKVNGAIAGCVALRALEESTLEMKRLYVRSSFRGMKLGKRLVEATISIARQKHYTELRLDTLATMTSAQALYGALGFVEIPPYGKAFLPGTKFYALSLAA